MKLCATLAIPISLAGLCVADVCTTEYEVAVSQQNGSGGGNITCSLSSTCLVYALMHISVLLDSLTTVTCETYNSIDVSDFGQSINGGPNSIDTQNVCTVLV